MSLIPGCSCVVHGLTEGGTEPLPCLECLECLEASKGRRFYVESLARLSDVRLLPLLAVMQPQSLPPPASDPAAVEREVTPASRGGGGRTSMFHFPPQLFCCRMSTDASVSRRWMQEMHASWCVPPPAAAAKMTNETIKENCIFVLSSSPSSPSPLLCELYHAPLPDGLKIAKGCH